MLIARHGMIKLFM